MENFMDFLDVIPLQRTRNMFFQGVRAPSSTALIVREFLNNSFPTNGLDDEILSNGHQGHQTSHH
jgi:hypothetical protein